MHYPFNYYTCIDEKWCPQAALDRAKAGRTTIIVAHRLIYIKLIHLCTLPLIKCIDENWCPQAALDRAKAGRTTIIVAHRLSTVRAADKILAIKAGVGTFYIWKCFL